MCHEVCFQVVLHFIKLTTKTAHHIREAFMQNCYFGSKDDGYDANWLPLWLEKHRMARSLNNAGFPGAGKHSL